MVIATGVGVVSWVADIVPAPSARPKAEASICGGGLESTDGSPALGVFKVSPHQAMLALVSAATKKVAMRVHQLG
jgi:hypothetical protein